MSPPRAYRLHIILSVLFSFLVLAAGATIGWLGYLHSRSVALASAEGAFERIGRETRASVQGTFEPVARFARLLAAQPLVRARTLDERLVAIPTLRLLLEGRTPVAAAYAGYADGGFVLLRPVRDDAARRLLGVGPAAAYFAQVIVSDAGGVRRMLLIEFDADLREIRRREAAATDYDPRTRPWYRLARGGREPVVTEPYLFHQSRSPGITIAMQSEADAVVGIDVTLQQVADTLAVARTYPEMQLVLFDQARRVLAHAGATAFTATQDDTLVLPTLDALGVPVLARLQPAVAHDGTRKGAPVVEGARPWTIAVLPVPALRGTLSLGIAIPLDELLAGAYAIRNRGLMAALVVLLVALPLTWWVAARVARTLREVTREAQEIEAFKLDGVPAGPSIVKEVDQLSSAVTRMRDTIRRFLDISASLAAERDFAPLLKQLVRETASIIGATGGLVYLLDEEAQRLDPAAFVSPADNAAAAPEQPIDASSGALAADALRAGTTVVRMIAAGGHAPDTEFLAGLYPGVPLLLLAFPLRTREGHGTGVLVLFAPNATPPSAEHVAFAEALSGTAAVAIETQRLMEERKALLDAFIKLIAGAIDAKSPYTGGHCQRVPELTMMLARSACEATEGPLRDFALSNEQWEELQIAAWLHDCGKVTTPEYVVDKATKLETIYDRIHEIRMRFEVLKRDAEIEYWREVAAGADAAVAKARRDALSRTLDEEFAFVASCNVGGEFLAPDKVAQLREIGSRTWLRTLDDRIGIAREELSRKSALTPVALPAVESLLADKPEHIVPRTAQDGASAESGLGFRMKAPEHKFNRGELHNLSVARGTLTDEERYVINHHIVQTIVMLSQLPFPRHLRRVPEIAGGHHETMIGTGYPRALSREDMSWTARMMAIADIFEALTAADRPYKEGKRLSEAIRIMGFMKRDRHIDPDLFDLFLTSGIYRRYAERFMRPEQIDPVDVSAFLGPVASPA